MTDVDRSEDPGQTSFGWETQDTTSGPWPTIYVEYPRHVRDITGLLGIPSQYVGGGGLKKQQSSGWGMQTHHGYTSPRWADRRSAQIHPRRRPLSSSTVLHASLNPATCPQCVDYTWLYGNLGFTHFNHLSPDITSSVPPDHDGSPQPRRDSVRAPSRSLAQHKPQRQPYRIIAASELNKTYSPRPRTVLGLLSFSPMAPMSSTNSSPSSAPNICSTDSARF